MNKHKTETALVLRRVYDLPPRDVFAAWTTKADLEKWYSAAADFEIYSINIDLRVGGKLVALFGPKGGEPITETDEYLEIVPGRKLVFDMTLTQGANFISKTRITIAFNDIGDGKTELVITDVGDDSWHHAQGWRPALDLLDQHLSHRRN
jgi:uncharacterized protein YndB with AHSA1/START domain